MTFNCVTCTLPMRPLNSYIFGKSIGQGSFGKVSRRFHLFSLSTRAVKKIPTSCMEPEKYEQIDNEIDILSSLKHPNIVKYFTTVKTASYTYIVMEYLGKKSLFDMLSESNGGSCMLEPDARRVFKQIASGLAYMHSRNIAHLDLKPDNVMMKPTGRCKIIDFGYSQRGRTCRQAWSTSGVQLFVAPELFGDDDKEAPIADVWSLGAVLLFIVSANARCYEKSLVGERHIVAEAMVGKSDGLRELVHRMLKLSPKTRVTSAEVLKHRWLAGVKAVK